MATGYFEKEEKIDDKVDTGSVWVWILFMGVLGINILFIIPYMIAISETGSSGFLSTGVHRGVSRYAKKHEDVYGEVNIAGYK